MSAAKFLQWKVRNLAGCKNSALFHPVSFFALQVCKFCNLIEGNAFLFGSDMETGCDGGLCIDDNIRQGVHKIAGERGHFLVDPKSAKCYCGNIREMSKL